VARKASVMSVIVVVFALAALSQIKGFVLLPSLTFAVGLTTGIPHCYQVASDKSLRADKLNQPGTQLSFFGRKISSFPLTRNYFLYSSG